ncbi:DUF1194 domain-containing protein [Albimonas sp. CAU 1670]|uniref:DUF1194 domain-containing protein n=1 Tax=Albimonas sp. CAU 1670 TaxID=3032599 RepID=UPI0023DA00D7|nr:DUF1194 domain-containing protein [Albimonas sp. CAU 1670]MDF2235659.1 DUF1194 domain-containing protein [Albimonas sp. CAU 1670]
MTMAPLPLARLRAHAGSARREDGGRRKPGGRGARLALVAAGLVAGLAAPASAACALGLALALDVSSSVDEGEYALQARGLAEALEDPDVKEALLDPGTGEVRIAVYEWSGRWQHALVADWRPMTSPQAIDELAARVRTAVRSHSDYPTALGHAIGFASRLLDDVQECERRVLDVSGDGANNDGYEPMTAYSSFPMDDVTVNALVVGGVARPQLVRYFETMVIKGVGAFAEVAEDYGDYAEAMKRKLLREIRPPLAIGALEAPAPEEAPPG